MCNSREPGHNGNKYLVRLTVMKGMISRPGDDLRPCGCCWIVGGEEA